MGQVQNLLHEVAKFFELISEQFILVLPNIYSRSDERGLGLLDQPTLILVQSYAHRSLFSLQGKNKILWFGLASGTASLLAEQIYNYYMDQYLTSHFFPPSLKVK